MINNIWWMNLALCIMTCGSSCPRHISLFQLSNQLDVSNRWLAQHFYRYQNKIDYTHLCWTFSLVQNIHTHKKRQAAPLISLGEHLNSTNFDENFVILRCFQFVIFNRAAWRFMYAKETQRPNLERGALLETQTFFLSF